MPFRKSYIYPLKSPERFITALGKITRNRQSSLFAMSLDPPADVFTHALVAHYGPIPADAVTHDAFVSTDQGDVHPNMDKPISLHLHDVVLNQGRLLRLE